VSRLLELRLRNFALVRDARLDCEAGFGALSGETGAGKSLCIAAVRWALGGRAEGEAVGEGTSVRAVFELVRMHRVFDICATRDDAVRAFAARGE